MHGIQRNLPNTVETEESPWFVEAVEQASKGDTLAFDSLYQFFYTPIRLYLAHMVGDDEEGYDLAQETFLKAWQGLPGIRNIFRFDTWLYRIATNTAIDHLRRRKFRWPLWKCSEEEILPDYMCMVTFSMQCAVIVAIFSGSKKDLGGANLSQVCQYEGMVSL